MASSLCRSRSLTNVFVQQVTVLDIVQVKANKNEWTYVIGVTWSDTREHKIYRTYQEVSNLCAAICRSLTSDKHHKSRFLKELPKVPARGFFDWSTLKLMVRHQAVVDSFFRVLITLPAHISRQDAVLDFYEMRDVDNENYVTSQSTIVDNRETSSSHRNSISDSTESRSTRGLESDSVSGDESQPSHHVTAQANHRTRPPPAYLAVTSCFEDDVSDSESSVDLLEDVTSLELYEDYSNSNNYYSVRGGDTPCAHNGSRRFASDQRTKRCEDERWLRECEEIISPYSPNKAYFRLVHVLDNIEV